MVMHSFCTIFSVPSILLLAPKAKKENGRGNAGKKTVKLLQNGLQNPARRSIITWPKSRIFQRTEEKLPV
jgi:hypothetical protein